MPKRSNRDQETGFIRSYWDEIMEMEADLNGAVTIAETASKRPGVLDITLSFVQAVGTVDAPISQCKYKYTFPSAREQTYAASKWVAARALREVAQAMVEDLERTAKKRR